MLFLSSRKFILGNNVVWNVFLFFFFYYLRIRHCWFVQVRVCVCAGHRRKLLRAWVTLRDSRGSLLSALDDRGRSSFAWAFESRRWSEHVTISVLGIGATGSSILSFFTSTSRRAFAPERFGLPKPFSPMHIYSAKNTVHKIVLKSYSLVRENAPYKLLYYIENFCWIFKISRTWNIPSCIPPKINFIKIFDISNLSTHKKSWKYCKL